MDINSLTVGQAKELAGLFGSNSQASTGINYAVGQIVLIRTYSAGIWCGTLTQKVGNEVVLSDARRMCRWWAAKSISLSAVAKFGIIREKSKIAPKIDGVWLEAIEIIAATKIAADSIFGAENAKAE